MMIMSIRWRIVRILGIVSYLQESMTYVIILLTYTNRVFMAISPTKLRANLYHILDQIIETQKPFEVVRKGHTLKISVEKKQDGSKISHLSPHPGTICGDPDDIIQNDWTSYWSSDDKI